MDALIFLTSSYGASHVVILVASTIKVLSEYSTSAPKCLSKSDITCTSFKFGTPLNVDFPFANNVAAIIGNTEHFFAPSILNASFKRITLFN